jgi:hypothetical protein
VPTFRRESIDVAILYGEPWQHLVADDFLPADVLERSLEEVAAESYEYGIEYRGSGRIEFSLLRSETLWRAVYSKNKIAVSSYRASTIADTEPLVAKLPRRETLRGNFSNPVRAWRYGTAFGSSPSAFGPSRTSSIAAWRLRATISA